MKNANQPAYPVASAVQYSTGLTKRELIAAQNMASLLGAIAAKKGNVAFDAIQYLGIAEVSIAAADALLSELAKPQTND